MKKAILSDIHANMPALEAVLKDLKKQGLEQKDVICLGDIVGYGPQPVEAIDAAMGFQVNLMGNHDEAVIFEPMGFNYRALMAIRWTKRKLEPGVFSFGGKNKKRLQFLRDLKITYQEENAFFVHGSPREPTTEYLLRGDCEDANTARNQNKMKDIFQRFEHVCIVGHTHIPCVIEELPDASVAGGFRYHYRSEKEVNYSYKLEPGQKAVLNAGAVGQPRDGDTRACYLIWEDDTFTWRRVEYNLEETARMIRKIKELDDYNAERLELGV